MGVYRTDAKQIPGTDYWYTRLSSEGETFQSWLSDVTSGNIFCDTCTYSHANSILRNLDERNVQAYIKPVYNRTMQEYNVKKDIALKQATDNLIQESRTPEIITNIQTGSVSTSNWLVIAVLIGAGAILFKVLR